MRSSAEQAGYARSQLMTHRSQLAFARSSQLAAQFFFEDKVERATGLSPI